MSIAQLIANLATATEAATKPVTVLLADKREGQIAWWRSEGQRVEIEYRGARWLHHEGPEWDPTEYSYVFSGSNYSRTYLHNTTEIAEGSILREMRGEQWDLVEETEPGQGILLRSIGEGSFEVAAYRLR
jgi:hypothetical protein